MKALSLKQPWAELVVSGKKTIEIRKWNTKHRGEFLIHASLNTDKKAEKKYGFNKLPTGCIIGKATLIDVKKYHTRKEFEKDSEKHFAKDWWHPKAHRFILINAKRLPNKKMKGQLNFFEAK